MRLSWEELDHGFSSLPYSDPLDCMCLPKDAPICTTQTVRAFKFEMDHVRCPAAGLCILESASAIITRDFDGGMPSLPLFHAYPIASNMVSAAKSLMALP